VFNATQFHEVIKMAGSWRLGYKVKFLAFSLYIYKHSAFGRIR